MFSSSKKKKLTVFYASTIDLSWTSYSHKYYFIVIIKIKKHIFMNDDRIAEISIECQIEFEFEFQLIALAHNCQS